MFSFKFYKIFNTTFSLESIEATASESSSQAVCLDIIIKTSKWHKLRQYFSLYCQLWKYFLRGSKKMAGVEILVWVKHMVLWTFVMILWNFIVLSCDSSLFSVFFCTYCIWTSHSIHYFIEKVLFPKIKRLIQYLESY